MQDGLTLRASVPRIGMSPIEGWLLPSLLSIILVNTCMRMVHVWEKLNHIQFQVALSLLLRKMKEFEQLAKLKLTQMEKRMSLLLTPLIPKKMMSLQKGIIAILDHIHLLGLPAKPRVIIPH